MNNEFGDPIVNTAPEAQTPEPVQFSTKNVNEFGDPIDTPKITPQEKVVGASTADPEAAAQAISLSKRLPLPAGLIEKDVPKYQQDVHRNDAVDAVQTSPAVAAWVDKNPQHARAAIDDFPAVKDLVDSVKHFNSTIDNDVNQTYDQMIKGFQLRPSKLWGAVVTGDAPDFKEQRQQMIDFGAPPAVADRLARKMQVSKEIQDTIWASFQALFAYPAAYVKELIGKPLEERTGIPSEVYETGFWTALMGLGLINGPKVADVPHPFRSAPGDMDTFLDTAALYRERGKTTYQEMQDALRPKVEPQKLLEGPGEPKVEGEPAEATAEPHIPAVGDPAKFALQGNEVPRPGNDFVVDRAHVEQHTKDLAEFDNAFKKAQETKLRERSPEAVESLLQDSVGDNKVYLPAETVAKLYQNIEPAPNDGILGWASSIEQKVATSLATGADVQIPMAQFLANADPAIYDQIKDEIRFRETGVNNEDSKEITQKKPEDYEIETSAHDPAVDMLARLQPELFEPVPEKPVPPEAVAPEEPLAETRKVRAGADVARIAALLGPSRYDKMGQMGQVTVKELFQNAFDAIKGKLEKGTLKKGVLDIQVDPKTRTVAVQDNGTGMTPDVLGKQFIEIAGTVKETGQASGGFGIAKMLYGFNNTGMRVYTLRDGKMSILKTNGPELYNTFIDPNSSVNIETRTASEADKAMFPDGSGTRVEVDVPTEYKDPSSGEMREIELPVDSYSHKSIRHSPLFHNIEVRFNKFSEMIGSNFPAENFTQFANVTFDWGTARIYVSKKEDRLQKYGDNMHVLSNGLWQFSDALKSNPMDPYSGNIQREFYIDVNPKVSPEQAGYPFDLNRQQFSKVARDDFQKIFSYMSRLYAQVDLSKEVTNFGAISYIELKDGKATETRRETLQPPIPARKTAATGISEGDKIEVVDGKLKVKGRVIPELKPEDLKGEQLNLDELKIDQRLIDPNKVILHDNLTVKPPTELAMKQDIDTEKEPYVSIVDLARVEFGDRFDSYIYEVGRTFHTLRNVVAELMHYPELAKEGIGVSFDSNYYGVSIRVPFAGMFINPAITRFDDPTRAAVGMIGTMIHELAHHTVRSHNAEFPAEMQTIQIHLDYIMVKLNDLKQLPGTGYDLAEVKYNFAKFMEKNHDIYTFLSNLVKGDTQTRGKRFKEAGAYEPRDAGVARDLEGARGVGLGPAFEGTEGRPAEPVPTEPTGETRETRAVKRERKALYLDPLFKDAKAAGIDEVRFARYSRKIQAADEEANKKALDIAKRMVAKKLSPEWKTNREATQQEVESDLRSRPDILADRFFRLGELPSGEHVERIKLSAAAVERLGGIGLDRYTGAKGVEPDDIAPSLQFANGSALIDALNSFEKGREASKKGPKGYFDQLVKEETDRRMEAKYGSLPARIADEARDIATMASHMDILTDELQILSEKAGLPPFEKADIEGDVRKRFGSAQAHEVSYETFRRGAEKSGINAEKALLSGKFREAFQHKLRQFYAVLYAKEAKSFDKKMATAEKNFRRIANKDKRGGVDQEAFDQAKKILVDIGFTNKAGQEPKLSLQEFIKQSQDQAAVAAWLADRNLMRSGLSYSNLTVDEFMALANSIRSIMHVGGMAKKIDSVHGRADLDNFVFDVTKELERFGIRPPWELQSYVQRAGSFRKWITASHVLVERLFDYTDKFDPNGPITRYIDRPLRDAYRKELILEEQVRSRLVKLQQYVDNSINDYIENKVIMNPVTGTPHPMTRQNLRNMMLHMGSESGIQKVTDGYAIDRISAFDLIRKNATKADVAWVNGMHAMFDEVLWPEASEMQRRYTGIEPDRVEARPYQMKLKDGTVADLRGGYAPVFYDKSYSNIVGDLSMKGDLFDKTYIPAIPAHGYTIPRTKYAGWVDMNGTLMSTKIKQMIHDIAFREAVRNAQKALANKEFKMAFLKYWGAQYTSLLDGWLRDIANVHNADDSFAQGFAHFLSLMRQNIVYSLTAVNPGTAIKHFITATGMSAAQVKPGKLVGAAAELGLGGVVKAARDLVTTRGEAMSPELEQALLDILRDENVREFIISSSPIFRKRSLAYPDTVRGAYERATQAGTLRTLANVRDKVMQYQRFAVALSDMVSVQPMWYVAYKDALVRTGDHDEAVFEAERKVARAHGSSFVGDQPAIMRLGVGPLAQLGKSFVALYNFWSHMANNMLQLGWDMQARFGRGYGSEPGAKFTNFGKDDAFASINQRIFLYAIVAIFAEEIAAPVMFGKDEGYVKRGFLATLRYFGGMVIGLREFTNALAYGYEPTVGMLGVMAKDMSSLGKDISRLGAGRALTKDWIVHLFSAIGLATGMGGPQVGKAVQGGVRQLEGRERPKNLEEYRALYRKGHIRP